MVRLFKCTIAGVYAKFFSSGTSGGMIDCQSRLCPLCNVSGLELAPFALRLRVQH